MSYFCIIEADPTGSTSNSTNISSVPGQVFLEEWKTELGAEGVHLLGGKLMLLLPHGLSLVLILHESTGS